MSNRYCVVPIEKLTEGMLDRSSITVNLYKLRKNIDNTKVILKFENEAKICLDVFKEGIPSYTKEEIKTILKTKEWSLDTE
jgi:hypothetical protein